MKKQEINRAIRRKEREDVRKKNVAEYFFDFSKWHRPWLQELADAYKKRGEFGIHQFMLADYYTVPKDKELALFASLVVSENDNVLMQVQHLREILTDSPTQWYKNRGFVWLGMGCNQDKHINGGGAPYWRLARLMQRMWSIDYSLYYENDDGTKDLCLALDVESEVLSIIRGGNSSPFAALTYLFTDSGVRNPLWSYNLLLLRLFRSDGLGMGLWGHGTETLLCPWRSEMTQFLATWFPDFRRYSSNRQDCVKLFGLKDDVDFFYAYMGYKELQKRSPKECSEYATTYLRWYEGTVRKKPYLMKRMIPAIML